MKKTSFIILILLILIPGSLFAGRQEGVLNQFRAAEEAIRNKQMTPEQRKQTLESNLLRGLREAVTRMFYNDKEEWLKDLNSDNFFYENPTSPKVYYVRYKTLLIRFDFATNPELYVQGPVLRKVILMDEATAHAAEGKGEAKENPDGNAEEDGQ